MARGTWSQRRRQTSIARSRALPPSGACSSTRSTIPPNASVYLGGVVRREGVTVAISTDGRAPALAGLLREAIDALLPAELQAWLSVNDARARRAGSVRACRWKPAVRNCWTR